MSLLLTQIIEVLDYQNSIQNKKLHRCNGNLSLHVLNIIEAIHLSARNNKKQRISIKCEKPKPFSNKEINSILK